MKYRREIDGLRAVAVLPVIMFHAGFKTFAGGFIGVDVFFVISGYLITTIILSDMNRGEFSIAKFYERRARRILPALFFVMLCCLPFAWAWLLPGYLKDFSQSLAMVSVFSSNFLFWIESGYFDAASEMKPLIHTWSLAVEEQYYILFPLFLMTLWKLRKRWIFGSLVVVGVSSLLLAQYGAYKEPSATFFLLPTRAWELATGALIAFYFLYKREHEALIRSYRKTSEALGLLGLLLIFFPVFAFDKSIPFPGFYALVPVTGAALIIIFTTPDTIVGRFLAAKLMVGIGLISYSAYLWHQPIFVFTRHVSLTEPGTALLLALSVLSILLAYVSWRYVEKPFRNRNVVSRKKIFSFAVAGSAFFAVTGTVGHFENGFDYRYPELTEMTALVRKSKESGQECRRILMLNSSVTSACRIGSKDKKASFIVFGDSHAKTIISTLDETSASKGISGLDYTYVTCPPLSLGHHVEKNSATTTCAGMRRDFYENLDGSAIPEYVILMQRWTLMMEKNRFNNQEGGIEYGGDYLFPNEYTSSLGYEDALEKDYVESVRKILDSGRKVVLVYPVPEMGWNVPEYLTKKDLVEDTIKASDGSTSHDVFTERNRRTYQALDDIGQYKNLIRIKPELLFCDNYVQDRCAANIDGVTLYYDDDHLSVLGAKYLVAEIFNRTNNFEPD